MMLLKLRMLYVKRLSVPQAIKHVAKVSEEDIDLHQLTCQNNLAFEIL